jgi:(1->4)-alpha-D-glucan 1-alpha-D-glucosylmutase
LKMFVTWQLLQFRRNNAELFAKGDYMPLVAKGSRSEHVCAFLWRAPSAPGGHLPSVAVIIPRLTAKLLHAAADGEILHAPMGAKVWQDTLISCPASEHSSWQNVFTGAQCRLSENAWLLGDVFADFPVAVLCAGSSE